MEITYKKTPRISYIYIVILLIFEISIVLTGYLYYKNFKQNFEANIDNQLKIIADLKVGDLEKWIRERRADAETVVGNEVFSKYVKRYFKNSDDSVAKREIKVWMREFQIGFNYDAVKLIDPQLVKRIIIPEAVELNQAYILPGNIDSLREGKMVFEDFYYNELKQKVFLKILIPVLDLHKLIAIIELRIDPSHNLYQILSNWSGLGETSETFIIRQQGNEVVYLSELKFQKNSALNFRIPIENKNVKAVQVVPGHEGLIKGIGYRRTDVVAYVKKVPNSSWFIVAQIDESEAFTPINEKRQDTILFFFSIFLLAGMGLVAVWRNQRTIFFRERIKSAEALRESEERFRMMFNKAPLSYQSLDADANFIDVNETWLETFGYEREEVIGKWFGNFLAPKDVDSFKERFPIFKEKGKLHGEFEMIHKDGTYRFIYLEGRIAKDINENFIQTHGILQDITLFKKTESERQVLSEIAHSIVTTSNLAESLKVIHQSLGKVLYAGNFFVALYDQNTELFSFPYWVDESDPIPEPVAMRKSLSAYVFRTGKPFLFSPELFQQLKEQNKVELVGSPSPSWIGVPLQTPARTIGVLVLQHYEKENVYSERDIKFLDTIGSQIALIIERKLAEETVKREMDFSQATVDSLPGLFYLFDDQGKFLRWNKNFETLTGYSTEEMMHLSPQNFFDEPDKTLVTEKIQKIFQIGEANIEAEMVSKDGATTPIFLTGKRFQYEDKQCILGMGIDISDRKKAEAALQNERLLLRTVIDNIPDLIYSKDIAMRKTLANLTDLRYSGVKSEAEILGKTDFDLHPKELAEGFYADDQLVLQSGQPILNREESVVNKDGEKHWLLTSKIPLKDKNGNVIGLVGIGRDVTVRKKAEEALRESEIKMNVIIESTADGIMAADGKGKVIKTNKQFAELWQIPKSLIDSQDDNALIAFVLDQLTNPEMFISKVQQLYNSMDEDLDQLYFKDGRIFERFSAPLVMQDSSIGRVWSFRDITERKQAEAEIKFKNEKLSKMNAEKDKFFSIISHDLRSPFNGFLGLTEIMVEDLPTLTMNGIQEIATSLRTSANNLFRLLENLLEWAKMQQGLIPFDPKIVELLPIVDECISIMQELAKNKGIELACHIPKEILVFADSNILKTIIRNLVSNALKFTTKGGEVNILAKIRADKSVEISISDTGIGMKKEMVQNLFRIDVQTSRKGTEGEPSSGLGLLLCKEFIEEHGGIIWVESEEGKGSVFSFTIPYQDNSN